MANMTPSRLGAQDGSTGSYALDNALFLKVFSGEVLTAFAETNVFLPNTYVRTIQSGKSASFPATWKAGAAYHTPGAQLTGSQTIKHNERVIVVDDLLVSDVFIANIDEAKNHYDVRSIYSAEMGAAMAREIDKRLAKVGILAARASATVSGGNGGTVVNGGATLGTDGELLATSIFAAAQAMDEKDVPPMDRKAYFKPAQYYLLAQSTKVLNRDWGGAGSYADGKVFRVAECDIVKTNNLPTTNIVAAVSGEQNTYYGDFTLTKGLVMHKSAVGTVKLMDLATEMTTGDWNVAHQGTLLVAKYAMGHGILRPEASAELKQV